MTKVEKKEHEALVARTCQTCMGFGGHGEYERHRSGDPNAHWVTCPKCDGSGEKRVQTW